MNFEKIIVALFSSIILLLSACNNNTNSNSAQPNIPKVSRELYLNRINQFESKMHKSVELNDVTANLAVKAYWDYCEHFPADSICADYWFKAGEISTAIKQYSQALMYYKKITDNFPHYKLIAESYYLQAFLYDNYLSDEPKAKLIYEKIINDYPKSSYANDSKAAIHNLGKSDEDLIKEFKMKNSIKSRSKI